MWQEDFRVPTVIFYFLQPQTQRGRSVTTLTLNADFPLRCSTSPA